jgi:hypothetical protein
VSNQYWGNDADEGLTRSVHPDVGAAATRRTHLNKYPRPLRDG